MWDSLINFFGGSGGYDDAGLEALINANDLANAQYGNDFSQYSTFSYLPAYYDQYYDRPTSSSLSGFLGNLDLGDVAKLGLGALGAWGSYQDYKTKRGLAESQIAGDAANRQLGAGDDFAKMHALAQIIQARQGINLDPSLAYAQAVRDKMGLSPDNATQFAGVDVGGPMQLGMSSADRLDEINRASGLQFAEGGPVFGGLSKMRQAFADRMQMRQPAQPPQDGMRMNGLLRSLQKHMSPQMQQAYQARMNPPQQAPRQQEIPGLANRMAVLQAARQNTAPNQSWRGYAAGGANYVQGGSPGQADDVNARLSHGEYIMDADVVSALGDGNTEAGAQRLDEMREAIRRHKRSAPNDSIPPPAKSPLQYLKGVK